MNTATNILKTFLTVTAYLYVPNLIIGIIFSTVTISMGVYFSSTTLGAFGAVLWTPFFLYYYKKHRPAEIIPNNGLSVKYVAISVLLGLVCFGMAYLCYSLYPDKSGAHNGDSAVLLTFNLIGTVIVAPILEELFFRQWIPSYMSKRGLSYIAQLAVSSFLFYSVHWRAVTTPYWYYRFDTLIMGILMFMFYMRTKDIRYCIIAHMIINMSVTILCII